MSGCRGPVRQGHAPLRPDDFAILRRGGGLAFARRTPTLRVGKTGPRTPQARGSTRMGYRTLAECVADLRAHGQLITIEDEIDPDLEMAAIQRRVFEAKG